MLYWNSSIKANSKIRRMHARLVAEKRAKKSRENEREEKKQEQKNRDRTSWKEKETQSKHTVHGVSISISYPVCGSKCVHICQWNQFVKLIFYSIPLDRIKCDKEVELNSIEKNLHTYNSFLYPLKLGARARWRTQFQCNIIVWALWWSYQLLLNICEESLGNIGFYVSIEALRMGKKVVIFYSDIENYFFKNIGFALQIFSSWNSMIALRFNTKEHLFKSDWIKN